MPSSTNTYTHCCVCKGNHRLMECRVFNEKTPTQRAKLVADNKLCFSCLLDKHTFRQCPQPRKCRAEGCNSSHNTQLHGADRVFPAKQSTNPNTIQSSDNIGQSIATTSQHPSNKTTTMSSVTDVKGLLQVTELQLVNPSSLDTKALVLCDTACSNIWVAGSLAYRLGLHGKALKLTVKGLNTEEVVDTRVVKVTVKPREHQDFEQFTINPFVKESLNFGSDLINVQALQETYPHLAVLDPVTFLQRHWDDTRTRCLSCHPPVRILLFRWEAITRWRTLTHRLGRMRPVTVKSVFILNVLWSEYRIWLWVSK